MEGSISALRPSCPAVSLFRRRPRSRWRRPGTRGIRGSASLHAERVGELPVDPRTGNKRLVVLPAPES